MAMRIIRQPNQQDKSPFRVTGEITPLGVAGEEEAELPPETAQGFVETPPEAEPEAEAEEDDEPGYVPPPRRERSEKRSAKGKAGRPRTPRGAWILDYIARTGCTRHTARLAALEAGYPPLYRKGKPSVGPKPPTPRKRKRGEVKRKIITMWMPVDIIEYFKEEGRGYQTRMCEALELFVRSKPQG